MRILLTGVSGFVGARLAPRLAADGHELVGLARDPGRVERGLPATIVRGDASTGAGLARALHGADVAYYLIHGMEPAAAANQRAGGGLATRERAAARRFADAAARAGVSRIVYLGGLVAADRPLSEHLESRLAAERELLQRVPGSVALRASIVIGARSRSFRFLVRLIERLPVLALPAWREHRTRPIDERDVIEALARCATEPAVAGLSLDVAGPDTLSYGEMIERIADLMLVGRPALTLGFDATPLASRVAAVIAGERHELIGPLMESLSGDLLPRDERAIELLRLRPHGFDAAVEHALGEWEASEPLAAR